MPPAGSRSSPETLQHPRFGNVFGLGDACSAPNAKTAAAARKQAPVVALNVLAVLDGHGPRAALRRLRLLPAHGRARQDRARRVRLRRQAPADLPVHRRDQAEPPRLAAQGEDAADDLLGADAERPRVAGEAHASCRTSPARTMPRRRATTPSPSNVPPRVLDAMRAARLIPALTWLRAYDRGALTSDLLAAVIVTIMLIPQSLAYAMLAGLPPYVGLYASILPLRGLRAVRLEPGARGRAGGGGLAHDRRCGWQGRGARHAPSTSRRRSRSPGSRACFSWRSGSRASASSPTS